MQKLLLGLVGLIGLTANAIAAPEENFIRKPAFHNFVDKMVAKHGFNSIELINILSQAKVQPEIITAMNRPAESKPWYQYRKIFITESRIQDGVAFWEANKELLKRAEQTYGIPPEIILGILGVETRFGQRTGNYKILDSLVTLAFEYPKRAGFFRRELEQYLLLTREEKIDPWSLTGSYAGAIGKPQFISSSYRHYAVDFDGDGKRDLLHNTADAIGSIANYFNAHQWRTGKPIATPALVKGDKYKNILKRGLKPQTSLRRLSQYGITPKDKVSDAQLGALIEFDTESGPEYWIGLPNFYVITRYNQSPLYAMAVYQLGQEIRKQYDLQLAGTK